MRKSFKKVFRNLVEYAKGEGYHKVLENHDNVSSITWERMSLNEPKSIYIQYGYNLEYKTYMLLHELGHHELRKDWESFRVRMSTIAKAEEAYYYEGLKHLKRRDGYIIGSLEEEYLAWDAGYKLGISLGIEIDEGNWNRIKFKCLKSYIKYYSKIL